MPTGTTYRYGGKRRKRIRRGAKGLNQVERRQAADIAKQQVRLRAETKHRAWLYPKTTYSTLQHNKPFFLFGGSDPNNGVYSYRI